MHLSLLSDCYLSDSLDDASGAETGAVAHRNGLLRGLVVMGVAAVLLGLTAMSTTFHSAEADPARCNRALRAADVAQASVWWESSGAFYRSDDAMRRSTSLAQPGTAVSLVALRQRFRSACRYMHDPFA